MLVRSTSLILAVAAVWAGAASGICSAGELRLHGFYQASRPLVRLGDVVEFVDVSEEGRTELERLPLFPAPQNGLTRRVTAQDIRETMSLRGISLPQLRVSGECRVEGATHDEPEGNGVIVAAHDEKQATTQELLAPSLIAYLQTKDRVRTEWKVEPLLTKQQSEAIAAIERLEISGGQAPWTGRQVFTARDRQARNAKGITFKADVERIARALVTRRSLAIGDVIGEDDVELAEVNPLALTPSTVLHLDDAIGMEVKQAISSGQVVQTLALRRPVVVKKGEIITVLSLAAGVQVKATAKSLGNAALGDVILLEAVETKKQFQARVTAPQEAMVFVDTPKVAAEPQPAVTEKLVGNKTR